MARRRPEFAQYLHVRSAGGATFSPDGRWLSFLTDITGVYEVWRVPVDVRAESPVWPEQLTFTHERVLDVRSSPTDDVLVISGDFGGNERTQLSLLSGDGTRVESLTDDPDVIHTFGGWSRDGSHIAYASNARDRRFFDVYERPLDGQPRILLQHDGTNYALRYAPDATSLLASRVESNTRNQLLLIDRATGTVRALTPEIHEGNASHHAAQWSADRNGLYLLSDRGREFLTLAYLDLATTDMVFLEESQWDAEALTVSASGSRLAIVTNEDGYSRLRVFDVKHGWNARVSLPVPTLPQGVIGGLTWSRDGTRLAFSVNVADAAPDIWVWDVEVRALWQATRSACGGLAREDFFAPSLVRYPTFDGLQIPAFLFRPRDAGQDPLPAVVYVHGGPEGQSRPAFNPVVEYFVSQGYAVLVPNVRGSTGYGYAYQSLDDVRKRMDSVADLKSAVDWLRASGTADPKRIAVMGGSYGGFMVLAALTTYPDLWAAGVDIVGIANFVTFLENTGPWRRKLRESEYGSLEHDRDFLEEISPIRHVDRITAPLMVVHGANDPRVPVGEAEQIVAALQSRGVPVEYLRFENEGHGIVKRANRLIAYPAIARFLDRYLGQN